MKAKVTLLVLLTTVTLVAPGHAVLINVPADLGINITNTNMGAASSLVADVSKGVLGSNSPATNADWLSGGGAFSPGIIASYNASQGALLPDLGSLIIADDDASENGTYSLSGNFYASIHYGKGKGGAGQGGGVVAYYLEGLSGLDTILFPTAGLGPNGFGGISSVRIWGAGTGNPPPTSVPENGGTLALFGMALLGCYFRKKFAR